MISSWGEKCGIADYSLQLANKLYKLKTNDVKVYATSLFKINNINPFYYFILGLKSGKTCNINHLQFEFSLFHYHFLRYSMSYWAAFTFLAGLSINSKYVITTLHEIPSRIGEGMIHHTGINFTYRIIVDLTYRLIFRLSNTLIVHSESNKTAILKNFSMDESKIRIMPIGCVTPILLEKNECKTKLNLANKKILLLFGFINQRKGYDLAVRALANLSNEFHLIVVGGIRAKQDEPYYTFLQKLVCDLNLNGRVSFFNYVPEKELPAILNAADIAILPYSSITNSSVVKTLMAYRIPIIASDLDIFQEIYERYHSLVLFQRNNADDLSVKIAELNASDDRINDLMQTAKNVYCETNWDSLAKKYMQLYFDIVAGHSDSIYSDKKQRDRIDWLKYNSSGLTIEIGCSSGYVMNYVGAEIGLDLNEIRARSAKMKYNKELIIADAAHLPFKYASFDTVLIPEILEHLDFDQAKLVISESIKIGKKILLTVPNAGKKNYDKILVENPEHRWYPTKELMEKLLAPNKISSCKENDFLKIQLDNA